MICPRKCFSPTWRIKISHVEIRKPPRGYSIFLGMYGETTLTRLVATRGVIGNGGWRLRPR